MKKSLLLLAIPVLLLSCSQNKRVLVLSHDAPQIDEANNTITCKSPKGHEEKELNTAADAIKVSTLAGDATLSLPAKGYYIANLKNNDTIIGSYQLFTSADKVHRTLSQEDLKRDIDSLELLMQGKNVSAANRNYFILPNTVAKITDNMSATIIAPYHKMSGIPAVEEGQTPEVYQFYTASELRAILNNLKTFAAPASATPPAIPGK